MLLIIIQVTTFDTGMLPQPPYSNNSNRKSLAWKPTVLWTEIANKQALNIQRGVSKIPLFREKAEAHTIAQSLEPKWNSAQLYPKTDNFHPKQRSVGKEGGEGSLAKITLRLEVVTAPPQEMDGVLIRTKLYLDGQTESILEH